MSPASRFQTWRFRLLLLAASLTFAFLLAEALVRWVFHTAPLLDVDIYYLDARRNLRMQPGATRRHVARHWDVTIAIDQDGFRDRLRPISSPLAPLLALGDSFAFGWGVNLEQSYLYLLEERLNRKEPLRVIKAGTPGTGPGDQLHLLEALADRYRPATVLLSFFVGNDFTDVQMGGLDQFEVQGGLLVRRDLAPVSLAASWRQKLARSSHLVQVVRALQLAREQRRAAPEVGPHDGLAARDPWLLEFAKVHLRDYPEATARGVAQTLEFLDRFQEFCRQRNAEFLLLVIPRSYQVYPDELGEMQSAFGIADQDLDLDRPQRVLGEWAGRRGVPMLDLLAEFRRHRDSHPGQKLYFYPDAHLNAAGHRLTAELLAAFLDQRRKPD